jgi:alpha/beta superfamily hydrolase
MARTTQRVHFAGHAGNPLAGILELPALRPLGFLIFSHCFTCNKDLKAIVRISRELAERGWGVLRFDFSGLGNSQGDFSQTNFTTNQNDLRAATAWLATHYQHPDFLIGHSFGGAVSMSLAAELKVQGVIGIAAPSDTLHLADLLERMDPSIRTAGRGSVTIGGRTYAIEQQMVHDFRSHDLKAIVRELTIPMLIFHSPKDETVGYFHALANCGFESTASRPKGARSLITITNANHLLTGPDSDCRFVAEMADCWCRNAIAHGE